MIGTSLSKRLAVLFSSPLCCIGDPSDSGSGSDPGASFLLFPYLSDTSFFFFFFFLFFFFFFFLFYFPETRKHINFAVLQTSTAVIKHLTDWMV